MSALHAKHCVGCLFRNPLIPVCSALRIPVIDVHSTAQNSRTSSIVVFRGQSEAAPWFKDANKSMQQNYCSRFAGLPSCQTDTPAMGQRPLRPCLKWVVGASIYIIPHHRPQLRAYQQRHHPPCFIRWPNGGVAVSQALVEPTLSHLPGSNLRHSRQLKIRLLNKTYVIPEFSRLNHIKLLHFFW